MATVDKLGTAYEDKHIATGYGSYIALPLLRSACEKKLLSRQEAQQLLVKCMEVLFYRDARAFHKVNAPRIEVPPILPRSSKFISSIEIVVIAFTDNSYQLYVYANV